MWKILTFIRLINDLLWPKLLIALLIVVAFFDFIVFGGVKRIARMSEYIAIVMAFLYIGIAIFVIATNISELPSTALIFKNAFGLEEFAGGSAGAAIILGIKRGLFSNEAGKNPVFYTDTIEGLKNVESWSHSSAKEKA